MDQLYKHALKVASRVWDDDEARSQAGMSMLRALASWDEDEGVPIEGWISFVVKRDVIGRLRKKPLTFDKPFWDTVKEKPKISEEVLREEFPLLCLRYLDGIPIRKLAQLMTWPEREVKRLLDIELLSFLESQVEVRNI